MEDNWIKIIDIETAFDDVCGHSPGYILKFANGKISHICYGDAIRAVHWKDFRSEKKLLPIAYAKCKPHPYEDIIKFWASTGCEVWVKEPIDYEMQGWMFKVYKTNSPDFRIPNAVYQLEPFENIGGISG